jgi:hypothetical protein
MTAGAIVNIGIPRLLIGSSAAGTPANIVFRFLEETPGYIGEYVELYRIATSAFTITSSSRNTIKILIKMIILF